MTLRKRKTSRIIERAKKKLAAADLIESKYSAIIEYSGGDTLLTKKEFLNKILECESLIKVYNTKLLESDSIGESIAESEAEMSNMHTAILSGTKSRFGLDSDEVKML